MVITVVCDVLGNETNGTTVAAMNLIRFLKKQGHTVRVLCADQDKKGETEYYIVPNKDFGKFLNSVVAKVGVSLAKPDHDVIREALTGTDLMHFIVPLSLGINAVKVAREMNIPITAGFHMQAENFTSYFKLNRFKPISKMVYKYIWKHAYQYVDGIHYPTRFIRNIFEANIKKNTPGYVISNGVHDYVMRREVEKPDEYKDKIVILSIGRLAREKSQDTLIKAVNLSKYRDKIQIICAGQGLKEKYYRKLSKKLPIEPLFKIYSREEIINVINYSDIYVHPAEIELEGIACLEAIACGKLTIVSDSKLSATRDYAMDEKCMFRNRNPKDLARVIDYWIEHPEEKKLYEQKYLENGQVFRQEDCMKKMEQMIFEVVEKHKLKNSETTDVEK